MDVPTFEWKEDVLVATVDDNRVAFRVRQEKGVERYVVMGAWALWSKEHEGEGWIEKPFDPDNLPSDEELLASGELALAYASDRAAYVEEAQEAYREFAGLTT